MARIFVSHTGDEGLHVRKLVNELRNADQRVFVDLDLLPTDDMNKELNLQLRDADVFIPVFSGEVPEWTKNEIISALALARSREMLIIPIVVHGTKVPPELKYRKAIRVGERSPSEYVQDILLIISAFEQRQEEERKRKSEVERDLTIFVNEALDRQQTQETKNRRAAQIWYVVGVVCLLFVLFVTFGSIFHVLNADGQQSSIATPIMLATLNVVVIGVFAALARYAYALGKSYMSESLKSSDRIHAIQFGKFFLRAFGEKLSPAEVKDAFQHWNIDRASTFSSLDPSQIDPQIYSLITQLAGAVTMKKDK